VVVFAAIQADKPIRVMEVRLLQETWRSPFGNVTEEAPRPAINDSELSAMKEAKILTMLDHVSPC
jgi:hypothetical protein